MNKSNENGDIELPKEILENGLDIDFSELNKEVEVLTPEFDLTSPELVDQLSQTDEVSYSKELVARPSSDITLRRSRSQLDKMDQNQAFDGKDFQLKKIVYPKMRDHRILNAFRQIRTKIVQKSDGKNRVVMVVSIDHGHGASFGAANLAAAFSYEGEKTSILVDCNQTSKTLRKMFPTVSDFGLVDYLNNNEMGVESAICQTGVKRMRYVPLGNNEDAVGEFFSSDRMKRFILQLKRRYRDRYLILNAPPIEASADAAILSEYADFIVVFIPYGGVSNQRVLKSLESLPEDKILGFVINEK